MTDTATQTETKTRKPQSPRTVEYGLEVVEGLPEAPARHSPIEDALEAVKAEPKAQGRWVCIAKYGQGTAATAAANVGRQRHGHNATVEGFEFATRRIDNGDRTGLFIKYDPSKVEEGGKAAHQKWIADRKAKAETKKSEREKAGVAKTSAAASKK